MRFSKLLVANRGEIACRILRCAREQGLRTVAVYSEPDRTALHTLLADEACPIGPAPSAQSYLRGEGIVEAALRSGAGAVHPGYGFLSENAGFARLCKEAGLGFVGPSPEAIAAMGDKIEARRLAREVGAPLVPGSAGPVAEEQVEAEALRIGFPILIKAAGGGGGKGMRVARSAKELISLYRMARSEARSAFGNDSVYLERYVEAPRHIEIQVLGDEHGQLVHLFERECSVQRRHQKVIEEAPATRLPAAVRDAMAEVAVQIARKVEYVGAGTIEFLVDAQSGEFYFLEMNTRLQVEHPVTELTVGVDLVAEQLRVAQGLPLELRQQDLTQRGAAVECRIYAEDPSRGFMPSPGRIVRLRLPQGPGVRNDEGIYEGYEVPLHYDPLLAKLTCWAPTREGAIARTRRALAEFLVAGISTPISYYRHVLDTELFRAGGYTTGLLSQIPPPPAPSEEGSLAAAVLAGIEALHAEEQRAEHSPASGRAGESPWKLAGRRAALGVRW
jgi:acetyl-CoA carboxylase, biotin carboxylase subunit